MTERIRWQDTPVGTISGHVGSIEQEAFAIWKPPRADAVSNAGPGSYLVSGRLGALEDCAAALRETITAALAGKGAD